MSKDQVTGIVLAGGRGTRFGGKDKGLHQYLGRLLIEHSLESLQPQLGKIVISCNRNQAEYAKLGFETVVDERTEFQGPLAGIEAGLAKCDTPYALIYACDQLSANASLVRDLLAVIETGNLDIVCLRDQQQTHYLTALLKVNLLPSLQEFLNSGGRKVANWYARNELGLLDSDRILRNINAEADLNDIS